MNKNKEINYKQINDEVESILNEVKTINLATLNQDGSPASSYAPYIMIKGQFYILISRTAKHYDNIINKPIISASLIKDEANTNNLFFRKRLVLNTEAEPVEIAFQHQNAYLEKFGDFVNQLFKMDFELFKLNVNDAKVVYGPGKAFFLGSDLKYISQDRGYHTKILSKLTFMERIYVLIDLKNEEWLYKEFKVVEKLEEEKRYKHVLNHFIDDFNYRGKTKGLGIYILDSL